MLASLGAAIAITATAIVTAQVAGQAIAFTFPSEMFVHRSTSSLFFTSSSRLLVSNQIGNIITRKKLFMSSSPNKSNTNHHKAPPPPFTYQLGKSIYIPLTSRCNSKTLPETRGGTPFLKSLPLDVIKSLILVRIVECVTSKQNENGMFFVGNEEELIHELECHEQEIESEISSWVASSSSAKKDYYCDDISIEERIIQNVLSESSSKMKRNVKSETIVDNCEKDDYFDGNLHPDPSSGPSGVPSGVPSVQTLFNEIQHRFDHTTENEIESIVFAGEGEPTLRLETLLSLSKLIRSTIDDNNNNHDENNNHNIPIRVLSNGLMYYQNHPRYENENNDNDQICINNVTKRRKVMEQMKDAGVTSFSVALQTSCPIQYNYLMKPLATTSKEQDDSITAATTITNTTTATTSTTSNSNISTSYPHECVCNFIKDAIEIGFDVEVTCVQRDFVDMEQVERLVKDELGVTKPIRWRSWFGPCSS